MRIVLIANSDWYLYNFRRKLALALQSAGHEVTLLSADGEWGPRMRELGIDWRPISLSRRSINPLREALTVAHLFRTYRLIKPDVVHHFTIKCVIYGSFAARWAGIGRIVNSITGLGHMLLSSAPMARMLRPIVVALYRLSLRGTTVVFQNDDNRRVFEELALLDKARWRMIRGSGVDVQEYTAAPTVKSETPGVLMVGRLLWAKGVADFVEAARIVKKRHPQVVFRMAGAADPGTPDSISEAQLAEWQSSGLVQFLGHRTDLRALYEQACVVVLASREGEGLPRALLEAAASCRPVVATDVPGCRDAVIDGVSGLLVPPKNPAALAGAITGILEDRERAARMGEAGRRLVQERYSDDYVIPATLRVYEEAPA